MFHVRSHAELASDFDDLEALLRGMHARRRRLEEQLAQWATCLAAPNRTASCPTF